MGEFTRKLLVLRISDAGVIHSLMLSSPKSGLHMNSRVKVSLRVPVSGLLLYS